MSRQKAHVFLWLTALVLLGLYFFWWRGRTDVKDTAVNAAAGAAGGAAAAIVSGGSVIMPAAVGAAAGAVSTAVGKIVDKFL